MAQLSTSVDSVMAGAVAALPGESLRIVVTDGLVLVFSPVASDAPVASSPAPVVVDTCVPYSGSLAPILVMPEMPATVKTEPTPAGGDTSAEIILNGMNGGNFDKKDRKSKGAKFSMLKLEKSHKTAQKGNQNKEGNQDRARGL